jgi:outer membrane immunogenic protein
MANGCLTMVRNLRNSRGGRAAIISAALLAAALSSGASLAADMPVKAPLYKAPPPVADRWTGFYAGVNGGYGWGHRSGGYAANCGDPFDVIQQIFGPCPPAPPGPPPFGGTLPAPPRFNATGGLAGAQGGFNWRFGSSAVTGIEVDYDWSGIQGSSVSNFLFVPQTFPPGTPGSSFTAGENVKGLGTVRGRLGFLPNENWLVYATGGFAYARVDESVVALLPDSINGGGAHGFRCFAAVPCFQGASSRTATGFAVGVGSELALWDNVSIKAEYLYVGLNGQSVNVVATAVPAAGFTPSSFTTNFNRLNLNVARVGINYHF